ncbi:hypothetical protein PBY51_015694 [Eleginops maclovinus]|uniref:Uncharacterized protein n=1 Tax=Eleginops maclovinus TaxID=56733 RepID=A0AAN7XJB7_ELEMC|nr:hypothetical protein PBY51_015694 [Eleginops maclovinus]
MRGRGEARGSVPLNGWPVMHPPSLLPLQWRVQRGPVLQADTEDAPSGNCRCVWGQPAHTGDDYCKQTPYLNAPFSLVTPSHRVMVEVSQRGGDRSPESDVSQEQDCVTFSPVV